MKLKNIIFKKSFQRANQIIKLPKAFFGTFNNGEYIIKQKPCLDTISSVKILRKENLINPENLKKILENNQDLKNQFESLLKNSLINLNEENFLNLITKIKEDNLKIDFMELGCLIFLGKELFQNSENLKNKIEEIQSYLLSKEVKESEKKFFLNLLEENKLKIDKEEIENYFEENFVSLYKNKSEKNFLKTKEGNLQILSFLILYPEILKNEYYLENMIKKMIFNLDINLLLLLTKKLNKEIKEDLNLILYIEKVLAASLNQLNINNYKNILNFSIENEIFLRSKFHMKLVKFFEQNFKTINFEDIPLLVHYINCLNFKKENLLDLCQKKLNENNLENNEDIFFLKLAENNIINFSDNFSQNLNQKFKDLNLQEIKTETLLEALTKSFNQNENLNKILNELKNRKIENKEYILKTLTRLVELKDKNFVENEKIDFLPFLEVLKNEMDFIKENFEENEILFLKDLCVELFLEENILGL